VCEVAGEEEEAAFEGEGCSVVREGCSFVFPVLSPRGSGCWRCGGRSEVGVANVLLMCCGGRSSRSEVKASVRHSQMSVP